jgi:GTP-binding protein Era
MNADREFVSGYVAIAGKPNVGKSTLLNRLLNFPLSIVTSRPQTTRHKLLGILSKEHYQVVFLDTPGLLVPKYALQKLMLKSAWSAIEEADLVLLSALHADGLDRLTQSIVSRLPHQPPFYPQGELTDRPQRFFVAEIVRQKVFEQFGEEIPYSVAVSVEEYEERKGSKDYIKATIICERESQKGMLIGKGGAAIKRLGRAARDDIEALIGKPVYLELEVEVIRKWRKDEDRIRRLGQI